MSDPSGGFVVVGDHTYAQPGTYSVATAIRDDEGQSVSDTSTATVATPALIAKGLTIEEKASSALSAPWPRSPAPSPSRLEITPR